MAGPRSNRDRLHLRVHAVNIFVRDQERALQFYRDQLGFEVAMDARPWVAVAPPDGSTILRLVAPRPESRAYQLIGRTGQVVLITEDVTAKYLEWRARGVKFDSVPRLKRVTYNPSAHTDDEPVWGGVFTRFKDPDGNSFALVGFDEVTQQLEAQRRAEAHRQEAERRAAQELEIATQVQARLFPQMLPPLRTLEYAGVCHQARQVGGDYYDFLNLSRDRVGLVIGDTAGKGMAAALLMANLQANMRSQCAIAWDQPQHFLRSVNQLFFANTIDSAYATLFFAEYDDRERRLRYANCGHLCALLLRHDGSLDRLPSTGTVLGLFKDWDCSIDERTLCPGDILALYTDGVTESFNDDGEEYGEQRLAEALDRHRGMASQEMLAAIVGEVRQFSPQDQYDDITLVVGKCRSGSAG